MLSFKNSIQIWIAALVLAACLVSAAHAVMVTFEDASLEAEVRATLGIPASTTITDTDMATMPAKRLPT